MLDLSNEHIAHIRKDGIEYIQFKRLLQYNDKITHCYTLKNLNVKDANKGSKDYQKICDALGINKDNIIHPNQSHTDIVEVVYENSKSEDFPNVDGLITDQKNKILSLYFADCTPILLYDPIKNVIGDIHSGWKGTVKKIGSNAISKMVAVFGCNPNNIICCIGPSIRKCHFEVEDDVKNIFAQSFHDESFIEKGEIKDGKQKYYVDSVKAIINMFKQCGLKEHNIIDSGICTVCNSNIMHSHRAENGKAGRNGAIISLI